MQTEVAHIGSTRLDGSLSAYLDLLRFVAAISVLLGHMEQDGLFMSWFPLSWFSHEAVIVFFVLSGLIIYTTTAVPDKTARDYVIARFTRVYSVALPAIIFSVAIGLYVAPGEAVDGNLSNYRSFSEWDIFSSLLFLNESWQNPAALTMNNPYWSLCYEVWYYIIFGVYFFLKSKIRWVVILFVACISGPSILALFPIWLTGVWLARSRLDFKLLFKDKALLIFLISILTIIAISVSGVDVFIKEILHDNIPGFWRLEMSQRLLTDYLIAIIIAINIIYFPFIGFKFQMFFLRHKDIFGYVSGFSFSLYLFHRPMTQLAGNYHPNVNNSIVYSLIVFAFIVFSCFLISYITERQLKSWRRVFFTYF